MTYQDDWKLQIPGHADLRALHEALRAETTRRHARRVPFADELFDRWERARYLGFGEGSSVYDSCLVLGDVTVGERTWIGPCTVLDGKGGLKVGSDCNVSAGVQLYTHDTVAACLTGGQAAPVYAPVTIGDRTYLGPNAIVTRGVTVGSQCVIGAAALVNADVPDRSIVFGVPGRVVGRVVVEGDEVRLVYDGAS